MEKLYRFIPAKEGIQEKDVFLRYKHKSWNNWVGAWLPKGNDLKFADGIQYEWLEEVSTPPSIEKIEQMVKDEISKLPADSPCSWTAESAYLQCFEFLKPHLSNRDEWVSELEKVFNAAKELIPESEESVSGKDFKEKYPTFKSYLASVEGLSKR